MKINVLLFSDDPVTVDLPNVSTMYNYILVTSQMMKELTEKAAKSEESRFILSAKALPVFIAFSKLWTENKCKAIICVGNVIINFALPSQVRRKWINIKTFEDLNDVSTSGVIACGNPIVDTWVRTGALPSHLKKFDGKTDPRDVDIVSWGQPLISVFTSVYKSGEEKIIRPLETLMSQTYNNWEWVVVDDSPDDSMKIIMERLASQDLRIKYYKFEHTGYIGEAKRRAANLCEGEWLVELDHDDRIMPNLLRMIVEAGNAKPDAGVIYTDNCLIALDPSGKEHHYMLNHSVIFGFGGYSSKYVRGSWHYISMVPSMNTLTSHFIIAIPLHVRAYRRTIYHKVGGSNCDLNICDDYDLILRMFLSGHPFVLISGDPQYLFYENAGIDNFTKIRDNLNATTCRAISKVYFQALCKYFESMTLNKRIHKSVLNDPYDTRIGCHELPEVSSLRPSFVWQNGRIHNPNREFKMCENLISLLKHNDGFQGSEENENLVCQMVHEGMISVVVVCPKNMTVENFKNCLTNLKKVNEKVMVFIIDHPDGIVRSIHQEKSGNKEIEALLKLFRVTIFGTNGSNIHEHGKSWHGRESSICAHYMMNYMLKIVIKTNYVIYIDASVDVGEGNMVEAMSTLGSNPSDQTNVTRGNDEESRIVKSQQDDKSIPSSSTDQTIMNRSDNPNFELWGWIGKDNRDKQIHGFYHHCSLPELLGYWQLDGSSAREMTGYWHEKAKLFFPELATTEATSSQSGIQ